MQLAFPPVMDAEQQKPAGLYQERRRKSRARNRKVNEAMREKLLAWAKNRSVAKPQPAPALNKGFSLLELTLVVAILAILVAIAIPNYLQFQSLCKRAEAYSILHGISLVETSYFSSFDTYKINPADVWQQSVASSRFKFYKPDFNLVSGNPSAGYGVVLEGNIDPDPTSDRLLMIDGDPRPWEYFIFKPGIYIVVDDLVL